MIEVLGDCAFYSRGEPQSFMTDNCDADRKALAATWSTSHRLFCIFHILQQVWRWLLHSEHGIQKHHRQECMAGMKTLVYTKSKEEFTEVWEKHPSLFSQTLIPSLKGNIFSTH